MNDDNATIEHTTGMSARALGALLLGAGLVMGYIGIVSPIIDIRNQAADIEYYSIAFFLTPFALAAGLIHILLGEAGKQLLGHAQAPKKAGVALAVVSLGLGLGLMIWFNNYMEAAGYGG